MGGLFFGSVYWSEVEVLVFSREGLRDGGGEIGDGMGTAWGEE